MRRGKVWVDLLELTGMSVCEKLDEICKTIAVGGTDFVIACMIGEVSKAMKNGTELVAWMRRTCATA